MSNIALGLYKYVDGVNDTPFPSSANQAFLVDWQYGARRMGGAPSITGGTINHTICLDNDWSMDVYVEYKGEKFFPSHKPTSSYSAQSITYEHKVDFYSERLVLDNVYFYDVVSSGDSGGKPVSNSTNFTFFGNITEFIARLNASMQRANTGYSVVLDPNQANADLEKQIKFDTKYISEALQEGFKAFGIPYYFVGKVCHYGDSQSSAIDNIVFEYGKENSLMSIEKTNANTKIVNRITGVGSGDNIPYYYPNSCEQGVVDIANLSSSTITNLEIFDDMLFAKKVKRDAVLTYNMWSFNVDTPIFYLDGKPYTNGKGFTSDEIAQGQTLHVVVPFEVKYDGCTDLFMRFSVRPVATVISNLSLSPAISGVTPTADNGMVYVNALNKNIAKGKYQLAFDVNISAFSLILQVFKTESCTIYANGWKDSKDNNFYKDLEEIGIMMTGVASAGDNFKQIISKYIPPQSNLMPSIYRDSDGEERFYDAVNNTYVNPDTGEYYEFPNPYANGKPKEFIKDYKDVKPTIAGAVNSASEPIDQIIKFAYDENDNDDLEEDGVTYKHPYFFALLHRTNGTYGFNLFDHTIDEGEMSLSFTSGRMGGCEFVIGVGEDSQKNLVQIALDGNLQPQLDEDGHPILVRDAETGDVICGREGQGKQIPQDWQNDTRRNEVWVALKKDSTTYGVIMPNATNNYRPSDDEVNEFVILHIDLPKAYILAAEQSIDNLLISYMAKSNTEHWNFGIDFSRIYLKDTPNIANALDENKKIKIRYNGEIYSRYVLGYTYKTLIGEPLPSISIELAESLEGSTSALDTAINEINNMVEQQAHAMIGYQQIARLARGALQTSNVEGAGSSTRPIYFYGHEAKVIDGLDLPENIRTQKNVEAMWGVSARGIATLETAGAGGGGTVTGINFEGSPSQIYTPSAGLITLPDYPSLDGYATQNYVAQYFYDNFTQSNIKSTLGIYDWALAAYKPSYNFSEIGSKPTTLAGYGITDAHITSGVITLGGNTITPATLTNGKIPLSQIPDAILGQLIYGGTVNGSGVVTLSQNAKDKWGITSLTLTSTNYSTYEGAFFIASADATSGVPSTLGLLVGDWVVATASGWGKIDNTDAVTGVKGDAESSYRIGNVNITKGNIGLGNVENTALSTWAGTSNITTLGTIATGVWHGTAIGYDYLASGVQTSLGKADTVRGYFDTNGLLNKANHYTPANDSSSDYSASASGATAAWSIDVVKGVQIQRDAKGHILGVTVTSGKIPAKPTYAFSDLTSHPTTLSDYGITDGVNGLQKSGSGYLSDVDFVEGNPHSLYFTFTSFAKAQIGHTGGSGTTTYKMRVKADGAWSDYLALQQAGASAWGIVTDQAQTFGGDKTFNGNIHGMKGVSARGIATLEMASGGGAGTVTSIQFGSGTVITANNGLLSVSVGQGTSNGQIKIGGQDISVKGLGSLAYMSSYAFANLTNIPTTLGGYGITDAKIANGVITLGSNSITPLTSHQTLYNLVINNSAGTAQITYKPAVSGTYALTLTKAMVGLSNVENTKLSTWTGSANITTLGTITTGKWQGTAIADSYIASAATWNAKQDAISDLSTIRSRADEGHTAYGWGNHADAGYFAASSFTKANIKSTLGISDWALAASKPSYAFSEITGTASDSQIPTLAISKISGLQTALDSKLATSLKGAANGLAELDANGLVPSSQLPSYVDDVLEYSSKSAFPSTGTSGKIYVALDTNLTYRWSGTAYVEISPSLALGETSSTAYRGDRGKTAYDHATETKSGAQNSGFYKFSVTAQGHISGVAAVSASDLTTLIGSTTYAPYNSAGYLPLSGGENNALTNALYISPTNASGFQDGIILNDRGAGSSEGLRIRFTSASYTTGHTFNIRPDTGDAYIDANKIWHEGNDGSGSGLDADKLDGQEGSYYATSSSVTTLQGYFTNGVANNADKVDGYHASELYVRGEHRYGLENYIYDVVAGGQTTRVDDDTITTSGTTTDTYFFIKTTENLVPDEIYTFGFYVEGYTGTGTWVFRCSNSQYCATVSVNKNGWVWGTGTAIPSGGTATSQLLIDDAGSGNARALTFSKFIMVKGYALPAYVKAMRKQTIGYASALTTDAGGATTPVYFSNGVPVACTSYANASVNYANSAGAVAWTNVSSRPTKLSDFTDDLGSSPTHTHSQYLEKVTYEWNKSIAFGSTGYLLIGKFPMYDSNITIDIDSTTSTTYHGTLVIATQNINTSRGGSYVCNVYGDATNTVTSAFVVQYSSGSNKFNVYFKPLPWSKNLIHIRAVSLAAAPTESEICTSVSSVPTTDLLTVTNALTATFLGISATAASATKLQTARTIWGQSFDGTSNIGVTTSGTMRYLAFRNKDNDGNAGYVGRGGSTNDIQLSAYAGNKLQLGANGSDGVITIDTNLKVGIGTSSPVGKLDVNGTIIGKGVYSNGYYYLPKSGESGWLQCIDNGGNHPIFGYGFAASGYDCTFTGNNVHIVAGTSWGSRTKGIEILANGNVGIGLASPSEKLHVAGNILANGNIVANGGVAARGMATLQGGAGTANPVTQINIGNTPYTPTNGIVSLPAYPTWANLSGKPTNVSAFTNDSGYIDSSALAVTFTSTTLTSSSTSVYLNNTVQRDTLQKVTISSANAYQTFTLNLTGNGSYYGYHRQVLVMNNSGKSISLSLAGASYIYIGTYEILTNGGWQHNDSNPIPMDSNNQMFLLDIIQASSSEYPVVKVTRMYTWAD